MVTRKSIHDPIPRNRLARDVPYAMVIAKLGFLAMNLRGFLKWSPPSGTNG